MTRRVKAMPNESNAQSHKIPAGARAVEFDIHRFQHALLEDFHAVKHVHLAPEPAPRLASEAGLPSTQIGSLFAHERTKARAAVSTLYTELSICPRPSAWNLERTVCIEKKPQERTPKKEKGSVKIGTRCLHPFSGLPFYLLQNTKSSPGKSLSCSV